MEKVTEGLVKGVTSGDCIIISGKLKKNSNEKPEEKTLFLSLLSAPRVPSLNSPVEEPFGFEARRFLKNIILGKVVKYTVDYKNSDRQFGQVFLENKNINLELIKKGYAKLVLSKANEAMSKTEYYTTAKSLENEASKAKLNIWSENPQANFKVTQQSEVNAAEVFEKIKGKEVNAIVEHFFNCSSFTALLLDDLNCMVKGSLRFVAIPAKDSEFFHTGKAYAERLFLHRDVKLKAHSLDNDTFTVDLIDPSEGKNLAVQVLKQGYSKLFIGKDSVNAREDIAAVKDAQSSAQREGLRCWKGYVTVQKETSNPNLEKCTDLEGVCQTVHSGDSISVKTADNHVRRIFMSHMKAPAFAKPNTNEEDKPWAWQSKEYLRKQLVGRKVLAEFDFSKVMKDDKQMNFYSIFRVETAKDGAVKQTNMNSDMLSHGLVNFNPPRGNDNDVSKYLEEYSQADSEATKAKKGVHSTKLPGNPNYCDLLSANPKKKKEFIPFLLNKKNLHCVMEYVFSGIRFKLRVESAKCYVNFKLIGLRAVEKDKNNSKQFDILLTQAVEYLSDNFLQREGTVDIVHADKSGNYFGFLTIAGKNIGSTVLQEGLAVIHNPQNNPLPNEYRKSEKQAETELKGLWAHDGVNLFLKEGEVESTSTKIVEKDEKVKIRVTDIFDLKNFYANVMPNKQLSQIESVLEEYNQGKRKTTPLAPPIKKGTLCMAKYSEDDCFYRVRITNVLKDKFEVEFIDYGTVDFVYSVNLVKMDDSIATLEPQVVYCELANLKYSKNSMKKSLSLYPDIVNLEKVMSAHIVYSYVYQGKVKQGVYLSKSDKGNTLSDSLNYELLAKGYAKLNLKKPLNKNYLELKEVQKKAEANKLGLWVEMEKTDDEDEAEEDEYKF